MQVLCQHLHYVNAVEKTMKVSVTLRSKCVDKCTYALITILSISKGNVHTQVHNSTVVFFNCEWEEYSLYVFFFIMSTACLPSILLLTNPDLLHTHSYILSYHEVELETVLSRF